MLTQKRAQPLRGNMLAACERDVRMPGTKVRLQTGVQGGVGHFFVQLK